MSVKIDPNTLYPISELRKKLKGVVGLDTFLGNLGLREERIFRDAVWGSEILDAVKEANPYQGQSTQSIPGSPLGASKPGRGKSQRRNQPPVPSAVGPLSSKDLK